LFFHNSYLFLSTAHTVTIPELILSAHKMKHFWQKLFDKHETVSTVTHQQAVVIPLTHLGILKIEGEEAASFLQNLLTNDVNTLTENTCQLTGLCNPKGRLIASFWLIKQVNTLFAVAPTTICESLAQRLKMYVLRTKVSIADVSDEVGVLGLLNSTDNNAISLNDSVNRQLIIAEKQVCFETAESLVQANYQLADSKLWQQADIEMGIAMVQIESKEQFTPQQVNFDLVNGVSFKKGCYPGQEVVARLHYLGSPSRRMFKALHSGDIVAANTQVETQEGQTAGHVVNAVSTENGTQLLVSLKLSDADKQLTLNQQPLSSVTAFTETTKND
jgi:hypothetical protein